MKMPGRHARVTPDSGAVRRAREQQTPAAAAGPPPPGPRGPWGGHQMDNTVLIADDAEFMRAMLREIVCEMGLTVAGEAGDGEQAVRLYRELKPDLVVLDITMPHLDGIGALKAIVAADPDANVIMISALGQKQKVLEAIKSGARDFLVKPFDPDRVRETVSRCLDATIS
jgi:two-component system, chemotaxis family, chemotaxis protein CheY